MPAIQTVSTRTASIQKNSTNSTNQSSSNATAANNGVNDFGSSGGTNETGASNSSANNTSTGSAGPTAVDSPPANDTGAWTDPTTLPAIKYWDTQNYKKIAQIRLVPEIYSLPQGEVALTIDDGPSPYTSQILAVLREYHAHVTFFDVGRNVEAYKGIVKQAVADGNLVEDHSMTHPNFFTITPAQQAEQINEDAHIIYDVTKQPVRLFRPPYENFNNVTEQILQHDGMEMALWNRDPRDWAAKTPEQIVQAVLGNNPSGGVFDMHDKKLTLEALPAILQGLAKMHLKMVVLPTPDMSPDMKTGSEPIVPSNATGTASNQTPTKSGNSTVTPTNNQDSSRNASATETNGSKVANGSTGGQQNRTAGLNATGTTNRATENAVGNTSSNQTSNVAGKTTSNHTSNTTEKSTENQTSNTTANVASNRTLNATGNVSGKNVTSNQMGGSGQMSNQTKGVANASNSVTVQPTPTGQNNTTAKQAIN